MPVPRLPFPCRRGSRCSRAAVLPEEVAGGFAQQRLRAFLARLQREPTHDRRGDAVELAHDRLGRPRELVRQRQDRRLQRAAGGIAFAEVAEERGESGETDRDVREPLAPGAAERVGDDHEDVGPGERAHAIPHGTGRAVGIYGQQRHVVCVDVGLIDTGIRADPAVVRLGDQDALVHSHHASRLAQDHLDEVWIFCEPGGHGEGDRRGLDVRKPHEPAFGLRHDLLPDHEEIIGDHRCRLTGRRLDDEAGDVITTAHLADSRHADHFVAGHCSGGREAGLDRGWPEIGATWLRHAWSTLDATWFFGSGGREAGLDRGCPEMGARWLRHAWSTLDATWFFGRGGREAGLDRAWPEIGATWLRHAWSTLDATWFFGSGGREAGLDRGWPEIGATWLRHAWSSTLEATRLCGAGFIVRGLRIRLEPRAA